MSVCVYAQVHIYPFMHMSADAHGGQKRVRLELQVVTTFPMWVPGTKGLSESSLSHQDATSISAFYPDFHDYSEKRWQKVNAICRIQIGTSWDILLPRSYVGWNRVDSTKPKLVFSNISFLRACFEVTKELCQSVSGWRMHRTAF